MNAGIGCNGKVTNMKFINRITSYNVCYTKLLRDYWDWWYWDWWYPGYPGYPWYPVYPGIGYPSYGYSVGTIMMDMADIKNIETTANDGDRPKVNIIWSGAINGILVGSDASVSSRITAQMDQVFNQSPYLKKTSIAN